MRKDFQKQGGDGKVGLGWVVGVINGGVSDIYIYIYIYICYE